VNRPSPEAIVIGGSAGAFEALSALLPGLAADYPLPILIVVHLPPDRSSLYAELFRARCKIRVREAEDKGPIEPGVAYFAPPDYHLLVEADKRLSLSARSQSCTRALRSTSCLKARRTLMAAV